MHVINTYKVLIVLTSEVESSAFFLQHLHFYLRVLYINSEKN